ncbi:MAG: apolipoprotein A1/A4/E family protein, partial [Candidatus Omnitrophica bacterium]|nr:apolipoprotein A1/A4/E family protein [Candidatus Omnitrophota bacterium]
MKSKLPSYLNLIWVFLFVVVLSPPAAAQSLEKRIDALEDYVETFQPTLIEFSEELQNNIQKYTKGLESSLESYSKSLQQQVNSHLDTLKKDSVVLDLNTQAFQSVDTNGGRFLVSV